VTAQTMIKIEPTEEQTAIWINTLVPEKDLFYLTEKDLSAFEAYGHSVLVIPRKEFFNHTSYNQIQWINSYLYWNISPQAKFVIVAPPNWITQLQEQKRQQLLGIQTNLNRGLIIPLAFFEDKSPIPKDYIVNEEYVVVQHDMWNKLPHFLKADVLKVCAQQWDKWTCHPIPEQTPAHIRAYANQFATASGSNCLAAALFAVTGQEWMIHEWVHPETFANGLARANYTVVHDDNLFNGDVVVWVDGEDVIQHASYHIGSQLFFNKSGQTFFNPWKVVDWQELQQEWNRYSVKVYRKQ
jgi:hypothetical protein